MTKKKKSKWMKGFVLTTVKRDDLSLSQEAARLTMAFAGRRSRNKITVKE